MPKLSPAARAERRGNLLDAARRCFATHGINVSVEEICIEAGISKGAFYGYFRSKDAIVEALASAHTEHIDTLADIDGIEELINRLFVYAHEGNIPSSRLELEAWTHSLKQPALRSIFQENAQHMRDALAKSLGRHVHDAAGIEDKATMLQIFAAGLVSSVALSDGQHTVDQRRTLAQFVELLTRKN